MLETAWRVALDTAELTFYALSALAAVVLTAGAVVGAVALLIWAAAHGLDWAYAKLPARTR